MKYLTVVLLLVNAYITFANYVGQNMCKRIPPKRRTPEYWKEQFTMQENIEGGLFVETFRSKEMITKLHERYGANATRSMSTHIYYMLKNKEFSAFHQLDSDEIWHWYYGNTLSLYVIDHKTGELRIDYLGPNCGHFVSVVVAGDWLAAKLKNPHPKHYALVGTTMSPGFELRDFRFADKDKLTSLYPQHADVIAELTQSS